MCVCVCTNTPPQWILRAANCVLIISGTGTCSCDVLVEKCNVYCCCDESALHMNK